MARHWLALCSIESESWSGWKARARSIRASSAEHHRALSDRPEVQPSNRSSTTAIPSSSFEDVTSSATAFSSSWASAIATP